MRKILAACITFNEERILPYWLRHYSTFATQLVVHDSFSTDRTREIAASFGAEVRDFDMGGKVNDPLMARIKGEGWIGTDADWVIFSDADEFVYFPLGVDRTLAHYEQNHVAVAKTYGYEMVSDQPPTGEGQIYDEIKMGARDDRWYGKYLWNPRLVQRIIFQMGAHECRYISKDGRELPGPIAPEPIPAYTLHMHHIDSVEAIGRRYDAYRKRYSDINLKNGWGNQKDGLTHSQEKRAAIMSKIERVIP